MAGSLMPSLEDPQDMLTMPANLKARKVSICWVGGCFGMGVGRNV